MPDVELTIELVETNETATLIGSGDSVFEMRFTAKGGRKVTDYIRDLFRQEQSGYSPYEGSWEGRIGKNLDRLVEVLNQEAAEQPEAPPIIRWSAVKMPLEDEWPVPEPLPEGVIP